MHAQNIIKISKILLEKDNISNIVPEKSVFFYIFLKRTHQKLPARYANPIYQVKAGIMLYSMQQKSCHCDKRQGLD